jgi:hypothetical protein
MTLGFKDMQDKINSRTSEAVNRVGLFLLSETVNRVPINTGELRSSGNVADSSGRVFVKVASVNGGVNIMGTGGETTKWLSFGKGLEYTAAQYGPPMARGRYAKRHALTGGKLTRIANVVSDPGQKRPSRAKDQAAARYGRIYREAIKTGMLTKFQNGAQWFEAAISPDAQRKAKDIFSNSLKDLTR